MLKILRRDCGEIWCSEVCCGVVRHGVVWCGVVGGDLERW